VKNFLFVFVLLFLGINHGFSQEKYQIGIGFYSICCGTPDGKPIFDYIKTFKKANKIKNIQATLVSGLGKEGEHKYLFTLKELSKSQRLKFISKIKTICTDFEKKRNTNQDGGMNFFELDSNKIEKETIIQNSELVNL
jgi:hypothetical protein